MRQFLTIVLSQLILLLAVANLSAQTVPFQRGVNLTNWFQAGSPQQIQFSKYTQEDFAQIQSLGCDVIRLPINLHFMTSGAPDYTLDPLFLNLLDQAVDWAEELGIHLILDNHTFDPAVSTNPNIGNILEIVWPQMADHFQDRSELIYYEVLNEPHGISDAIWNSIQQDVVAAIRAIDTEHTIIIGPAGWNSFYNLDAMPVYEDDNLIYTFHFYEPFLFTHQGASWTDLLDLANAPFPYDQASMPPMPASFQGTWVENAYNNYATEGTVARVQELIDIAVTFSESRNVPVFCGEFGVYQPNSEEADRVFWYEEVRTYLEAADIPWTMWDYHGGFGVFKEGGNNLFEHDLNLPLLEALGLNTPAQTPFVMTPDSAGSILYDDYFGEGVIEASYGTGPVNYYNEQQPNYGDYCIRWEDADQYQAVGFDFQPNRDLSYLVEQGYALDFFVRGDTPNRSFDIRFTDTKTEETDDHPWRSRITIDETTAEWDSRWHHLHLPLADFVEHGSWDNNQWYDPIGAFDWTAIDRLEFVSEQSPLTNVRFWFDHVQLTDQDTAIINDPTVLVYQEEPSLSSTFQLDVFPNPSSDFIILSGSRMQQFQYQLLNAAGQVMSQGKFQWETRITLHTFPAGTYWLRVHDLMGQQWVGEIIKL